MKELLFSLKAGISALLLGLPILAIGQVQTESEYSLYNGIIGDTIYYVEMPNKLFIQKDSTVSQDYVVALLNRLTDSQYDISWLNKKSYSGVCRVVMDDALIDNVIAELLKDDGILVARRIFATKESYERCLTSPDQGDTINNPLQVYPYSQTIEVFLLNDLLCVPNVDDSELPSDSICEALSLTMQEDALYPFTFSVKKDSDIFVVAQKLYATGYFMTVYPLNLTPYLVYEPTTAKPSVADAKETVYYNLSGVRVESPSDLTIEVTRYGDGTMRVDKKLFK